MSFAISFLFPCFSFSGVPVAVPLNPSSASFLSNYLSFVLCPLLLLCAAPTGNSEQEMIFTWRECARGERERVCVRHGSQCTHCKSNASAAKNSVLPLDSEMQDSCSVTEGSRVTGIRLSFPFSLRASPDEGMCSVRLCACVCE